MGKWVFVSLSPEEVAYIRNEAVEMAVKSDDFELIRDFVGVVNDIDDAIRDSSTNGVDRIHVSLKPVGAKGLMEDLKSCAGEEIGFEQVEMCVNIVHALQEALDYAEKRKNS